VYDAIDGPYFYKGTSALLSRLGSHNQRGLYAFEPKPFLTVMIESFPGRERTLMQILQQLISPIG
jgi:hypothetical protein